MLTYAASGKLEVGDEILRVNGKLGTCFTSTKMLALLALLLLYYFFTTGLLLVLLLTCEERWAAVKSAGFDAVMQVTQALLLLY